MDSGIRTAQSEWGEQQSGLFLGSISFGLLDTFFAPQRATNTLWFHCQRCQEAKVFSRGFRILGCVSRELSFVLRRALALKHNAEIIKPENVWKWGATKLNRKIIAHKTHSLAMSFSSVSVGMTIHSVQHPQGLSPKHMMGFAQKDWNHEFFWKVRALVSVNFGLTTGWRAYLRDYNDDNSKKAALQSETTCNTNFLIPKTKWKSMHLIEAWIILWVTGEFWNKFYRNTFFIQQKQW